MAVLLASEGRPNMRKCAFCKHFYDPTNSVIVPKKGQRGVWEFTTNVMKPCAMKANRDTPSQNTCPKFECKV